MNIQHFAAALLVLGLTGCSGVAIDQPVGDRLTAEQREEFAGVWVSVQGDPETVEIRAAEDGRLILGHLKWNEKGQEFQADSQAIEPRRLGGQTFLYFQPDGKVDEFGFVQVLLKPKGSMEIYLPDPDSFRSAVDSGTLPGRVEVSEKNKQQFKVQLQAESSATRRFLSSSDWRKHYRKDPLVMRKLTAIVKSAGQ